MTEEKIQSAVRYLSDLTDELESYTIGRPRISA